MTTINNTARLNAGFARSTRTRTTSWGALAASGGRLLRTVSGATEVVATVGPHVATVAQIVDQIDRSPATFLHPLAVAADGAALDMPRLVRDLVAGREVSVPDCETTASLRTLGSILSTAKPGAAQSVLAFITDALDTFGPTLVPGRVAWFDRHGDHHRYEAHVELSAALAALETGDVAAILDWLAQTGSAVMPSAALASLCDWDRSFANDMDDADWETVELLADPQNRLLTAVLEHDLSVTRSAG